MASELHSATARAAEIAIKTKNARIIRQLDHLLKTMTRELNEIPAPPQRWSPSFRQLSDQIKVKSGFIGQAASGCDGAGQRPGPGVAPTVYASLGVRSTSDECGRRAL